MASVIFKKPPTLDLTNCIGLVYLRQFSDSLCDHFDQKIQKKWKNGYKNCTVFLENMNFNIKELYNLIPDAMVLLGALNKSLCLQAR